MSEQLQVLFPTGKEITIKGETLSITPFKAGQLPKVMQAVQPIFGALQQAFADGSNQAAMVTSLIASGGENILDIVSYGTRKPRTWVDELELDELLLAASSVFEVNVSFFVQRVLPQLTTAVAKAADTTGQTLS